MMTNFVLKYLDRRGSKVLKRIDTSHLQEEIKFYLASTTFTTSGIINARRLINEQLKSNLFFNYHNNLQSQSCPNQQQDSGYYRVALGLAFSQMPLILPIIYPYLSKSLLQAIFYSMNIVVIRTLKTLRRLLAFYKNIHERLWFVWF